MSQSEPTLAEIMRRLDELSADVKNIPVMVNDQFVRHEVYRHEWMWRTIGVLIIGALAQAIITFR